MATTGGGDGGDTRPTTTTTTTATATLSPQFYFCYQCNRTVSFSPSHDDDILCPLCNGGFLEELDSPSPNPNPNPNSNPFFSHPFLSSSSDPFSAPFLDPLDLSAILGGGVGSGAAARSPFQDPDVFNPFQFLQNYLHTLRAGGANIQFVIENPNHHQHHNPFGGEGGGFRLPSNLGDYFFGPGLEQLIQQLAENDPNRYGTPPASKTAVEGLPTIKVTKELLESDSSHCAVCMDEFQLDASAKQMPCKHVYHSDCILPWLELHNSCPVCRYELPTDDPEYEQRAARGGRADSGGSRESSAGGNGNGGNGGNGGVQESLQNDRTVERRFRISLPWPFRAAAGSPAEASNSSVEGNNAGGGEGNTRGSETRQEDLDLIGSWGHL